LGYVRYLEAQQIFTVGIGIIPARRIAGGVDGVKGLVSITTRNSQVLLQGSSLDWKGVHGFPFTRMEKELIATGLFGSSCLQPVNRAMIAHALQAVR